MRELIGERPNVIPTGLGNSQTEIDNSALLEPRGSDDENDDEIELINDPTGVSSEGDGLYDSDDLDGKSDISRAAAISKRKASAVKEEPNKAQKTSREGSKAPVTRKGKTKAKTLVEKYTEVAELEELTAQKKADADKARSVVEAARIKVKGEIQLERERRKTAKLQLKSELLAMKKLKMEHEMAMELQRRQDGGHHAGPSSSARVNPSFQLPSTPHNNYSRSGSSFSFGSPSDNHFSGDLSFDNLKSDFA